jgi:hypothetical protein
VHVSVHAHVFETVAASDTFTEVGRHATHDTIANALGHAEFLSCNAILKAGLAH